MKINDRLERIKLIRQIMVHHATNSPTEVSQILKTDFNVNISVQSTHIWIKKIREAYDEYFYGVARDIYEQTAQTEHQDINEQIAQIKLDLQDVKPGLQKAGMINTLISLYMRRQYVMEDMVIYARNGKWVRLVEQTADAKQSQSRSGQSTAETIKATA